MSNNKSRKNKNRKEPKEEGFSCPLGSSIMWWRGLIYKECPLNPSYRDMSACKDCPLRRDEKWENNKETWKEEPREKRYNKKKNKNRG